MHDVIVVGGGLGGLFTASELLAAGIDDVVVLEKGDSPGGLARTIVGDGFSLEPGAGTLLLPHPHLSPVLARIGAPIVPAVGADMRYVFTRDRLVALPTSPRVAFAPLVPWRAKFRAAVEPFIRRSAPPDETVDGFLRRRVGDGLGSMLAWLAASGVFAGDPARLAVRSAFPAIVGLEDAAGSVVRGGLRRLRQRPTGTPRPSSHVALEGMTGLAAAVASRLGDRFRTGERVDRVLASDGGWEVTGNGTWRARHAVLACRPQLAGPLLGGELAAVLERATSAPVVVVGLGGDSAAVPLPRGFGALVARDADMVSLGVLFESSYAPHRAPPGAALAKVIAGGATRPEVAAWPEDRLVDRIVSEVSRVLARPVSPAFVAVARHPLGIPQYEVGHGAWLAEIERHLGSRPGLHLTGWGYRGVGVAHVAADATRVARRIAAEAGSAG